MEVMEKIQRHQFKCPMRGVLNSRSIPCGWKVVHRFETTGWADLQRHMFEAHGVPVEAFYFLMGEKGLASSPPSEGALLGRTEVLDWERPGWERSS